MSRSYILAAAVLVLAALALSSTAVAQSPEGTADLFGFVTDAAGEPVSGYPCVLKTPDGTRVILGSTEEDGSCGTSGVPPGTYELLVLDPTGGDTPVASKQVTLTAGQQAKLEIRLSADKPKSVGPSAPAGDGSAPGAGMFNREMLGLAAILILGAIVIYFVMRSRGQSAP